MKEHLRVCFRSAVILVTLQKTVQAQTSLLTGIPNGRANFVGIGDLAYFTSANFLGRTGATARETMVPTVRFVTAAKSFMESNDLLISATSALQRRSSRGAPSGNNSTDKQKLYRYMACDVVVSGYQVAHGFRVSSSGAIGYPAAQTWPLYIDSKMKI